MKRFHFWAVLSLLLFATACSKGPAPSASPLGPTHEEAPATVPAAPATDQAEAMLGRGEVQAAIDLLTKTTAERPSADAWNLLSYAHLVSGHWQAAADAGAQALKLDKSHPYALYNTGMAQVELKQYPAAISNLRVAAEVQPDRAEPYLGLPPNSGWRTAPTPSTCTPARARPPTPPTSRARTGSWGCR